MGTVQQSSPSPCTGGGHLTVRFSRELFLRVPGMAPGGKPKCALAICGQGDAVSLGPEAQDRHAFGPDSFLRVEHARLPKSSPRVSLAARLLSLPTGSG